MLQPAVLDCPVINIYKYILRAVTYIYSLTRCDDPILNTTLIPFSNNLLGAKCIWVLKYLFSKVSQEKRIKEYLDRFNNLPIMRLSLTLIKKKTMRKVYEICLLQAILQIALDNAVEDFFFLKISLCSRAWLLNLIEQ